jgi:hypothetical protein
VLFELHVSPTTRNFVFQKTYERIKRSFFWEGMKQDIHMAKCDTFQCHKGETIKTLCTLQPLPIPPAIWKNISMEFIVGLPKSRNKLVIMVVVYHLYKYAHLCSLQHPLKSSTMAHFLMDNIFKLHGMPHPIVFDRDPTFTRKI